MLKKIILKLCGTMLACLFVFFATNVDLNGIISLPKKCMASIDDIEKLNQYNNLGKMISASLIDEINVGNDKAKQTKMVLKLFGFIPIKEVSVELVSDDSFYIGGIPIGFEINTKGLIIVGTNSVITDSGDVSTYKSINIKDGDIITTINGKSIEEISDIYAVLENCNGQIVSLNLLRDNDFIECKIQPVLDLESQTYKLGLWVRNETTGVGTLTFVNSETLRFGALGHPITDFETGIEIPVENGNIYLCNILGVKKGLSGEPGELRCLFMQGKNEKGTVEKNTKYGVFGHITNENGIIDKNLYTTVASRIGIRLGKAKLVSSVSGVREEYDIEIIKTSFQPKSSDKSMVFRVTDKRLLSLTGGIVQGMSGSPIMQDGKLIGAVTHVFISDPTKGYGVYADWMIQE